MQNIHLPFGSTLFFLVHVTLGLGFPDAEHSIRTEPPFLTCKWPPELMWCILAGTKMMIVMKIHISFPILLLFLHNTMCDAVQREVPLKLRRKWSTP